ncbi:MAG TPA: DUF748 domain-containing protein, partial [Ignavibacteriaceae bacterium]|nr:DUF748 domain-containing protein [Ignavibacteriaceae bacterium]
NIFPLFGKKIDLEELRLTKPKIIIKKLSETEFNFSDLIEQQPKTKNKKNSGDKNTSDLSYSALGIYIKNIIQSKKQNAEKDQWDFFINRLAVASSNLIFEDRSLDTLARFNINPANLTINNLHPMSRDTSTLSLNFKLSDGGDASAKGKITLEPFSADINLKVNKMNFKQAKPYLEQFAYLRLNNGKLNIDGILKFKMTDENKMPDVSFKGIGGIDDLDLYDTKENERFLEWGSLTTTGIAAQTNPVIIAIGEITLDKLYTRIAIAEDQTINVQKVFKAISDSTLKTDTLKVKAGFDYNKINSGSISFAFAKNKDTLSSQIGSPKLESSQSTDTSLYGFRFDIGNIKIQNSEMFFSDFSLPLKFAANIHDFNGEIIGISYGSPLGAAADFQGIIDKYGLVRIKGNMDPFAPMNYSDIKMNFNNIELTSLSPYSAKFMGYMIESGKLSLDIQYLLEKGMLTSYSKIFLNKTELGDEVEGEEGFGIPMKLALSLLKDGDGNIDLDLEVKGDLNDPEVDTGTLIWWAVKRVLLTIVTAPFRFLGNLLGINGDDLEFVDFDPGESKLLPNQIEKLDNLNKALNKRPNITLEIYGAVDTVTDAQAIRLRKLKDAFTKRMTTAVTDSLMDPMKVD